jgi:phosphate-selective porin OprO/OprP
MRPQTRLCFVFLICLLLFPGVVRAQTPVANPTNVDLEKRVQELEDTVRRLKEERTPSSGPSSTRNNSHIEQASATQGLSNPAASAPPPYPNGASEIDPDSLSPKESDEPLAGWSEKRGFFLRSADDRFTLRLTGQIQADYRAFLDQLDTTDIDSFLVRRARLGIEANMFTYYEFRLLPDFSNRQSPTSPAVTVIQDAYLNIHYWDFFQLEVGKFKQPCSYEQLIQDRFVPTMERSLIDQLVPQRDEGIMVHGQKLMDDRFEYQVSVSNGEINGDYDTNKLKDFNWRVAVRPLNDPEEWPILFGLQIGMSGTTGVEQEPMNPSVLRTPATVLWFQFNSGVRADGIRNRWSPELVYFFGPFGFASQYYHENQEIRPASIGPGSRFLVDLPFDGYYFLATCLLTGEERTTFSMPVTPLRPYEPLHPFAGPGAWELVARMSRLVMGDEVFKAFPAGGGTAVRLANPVGNSPGATEMTLGFNWYLNAWVRAQFNWEHAWFDDPVRLAPGPQGLLSHQDSLIMRFQVIF